MFTDLLAWAHLLANLTDRCDFCKKRNTRHRRTPSVLYEAVTQLAQGSLPSQKTRVRIHSIAINIEDWTNLRARFAGQMFVRSLEHENCRYAAVFKY